MFRENKKGFTLIELLVVVAIVGMLASIVLVNTWSQRDRARDANIKTYISQIGGKAELLYFDSNGSYASVCDESDDTVSDDGDLGSLERAIMKENGNQAVKCFESADKGAFAVSSPLLFEEGKHWCLESAGAPVEIDGPITSASCQ